jgi:hypothetical protein
VDAVPGELTRHLVERLCRVVAILGDAHHQDPAGLDKKRHRRIDGAGGLGCLFPAHHDGALERRRRRCPGDQHRAPAADEKLLEEVGRKAVCALRPPDHDEIMVAGMKQDAR